MAAFSSYQYHPFLLDSVFLPNTPQFLLHEAPQVNNVTNFDNCNQSDLSNMVAAASNNNIISCDQVQYQCTDHDQSSAVVDANLDNSEQVTQEMEMIIPKMNNNKRKNDSTVSSLNSSDYSKVDVGNGKGKRQKKSNGKKEAEDKKDKQKSPDSQEPPTGYFHLRARRGQATDSHSLAERVRREKISERMKILQSLVPGCDKVTGKALMLDEIINYVHSLQNQVEFLSMKLASLNPLYYDFGMDIDALMVTSTDQRVNSIASLPSLPSVQHCSPTQTTTFGVDYNSNPTVVSTCSNPNITSNTNFVNTNNFPVLDNSAPLLLQGYRPSNNDLVRGNNSLMWEMGEQRQRFPIITSGFGTHLQCSFH